MTIAARIAPRGLPFGRIDVAILLFGVLGGVMAYGLATFHGRPWALLSMLAVPTAVALRRQPSAAASAIVFGSLLLRLAYVGIGYANQIPVSQAAAARVFSGLSPYGVGYAEAIPPGEPFPYGPLGLIWWLPGPTVEFLAAALLMTLLIHQRAWLTLGLIASVPFAVYLTTAGANDYSLGLLLTIGLLLVPRRPFLGAAALALAASLKLYALAWLPALIGYAGWRAGVVVVGLTAMLWSPVLVWGVGGVFRSFELSRAVHPVSENALNLPLLRFLAAPIAASALFAKRWEVAVLLGSAAFLVFLFLDRWASLGYLLAVGPITGIALETWGRPRRAAPA